MKMNKRKIKYVKPNMEFNLALEKFEPALPLKKAGKKDKIKLNLKEIIILIIFLLLISMPFILLGYLLNKYS